MSSGCYSIFSPLRKKERIKAGAPTYANANIFCPYSITSGEAVKDVNRDQACGSLQEIRKFLGRDSKKDWSGIGFTRPNSGCS